MRALLEQVCWGTYAELLSAVETAGSQLLEPGNLRHILEKVGSWQDGAFTLEPDALRSWEARFAELSQGAA